jgi:hypothetical protein
MPQPTREDAQLIVQLAQWGTALGVESALAVVFAEDFEPETADALTDEPVRKLLIFGESIGTLTKYDLLNTQLVLDWIWIEGLWTRLAPAAQRQRDRLGEPALYENFEALATR